MLRWGEVFRNSGWAGIGNGEAGLRIGPCDGAGPHTVAGVDIGL